MGRDTGVGDEVKHHVGLFIHGQRYRCWGLGEALCGAFDPWTEIQV